MIYVRGGSVSVMYDKKTQTQQAGRAAAAADEATARQTEATAITKTATAAAA